MKIFLILCLVVVICFAIAMKVRLKAMSRSGNTFPTETKESAISRAIVELIATAGGIYVSLLLAFSFLDLALPGKVSLAGLQIDALAGLSLAVALLQPIIAGILKKIVL